MEINFTREEALALLKKYNKEKFHIEHALTLEGVMGWYARELGYGDEEQFWRMAGLLHDIDFEAYPAEHCKKAPELNCPTLFWKLRLNNSCFNFPSSSFNSSKVISL